MYNKPKLWRNCGQSINSLRHPLFHELLPVPAQEKRDFIKSIPLPSFFLFKTSENAILTVIIS